MTEIRREYEFNGQKFMIDIRLKAPGKTLRELGIMIGVSASAISRWDHSESLDMRSFMRACAVFHLTPGDYFTAVVWRREDA